MYAFTPWGTRLISGRKNKGNIEFKAVSNTSIVYPYSLKFQVIRNCNFAVATK